MAAGGSGIYLLGLMSHNEHERESGFLSGEAAVDSLLEVEALKYATRRERPLTANASGQFWHGGTSFPFEHAAEAWSIAGVIAHEHPNPFVKLLSYGAATAISASRVTAKQHFPSDVLIGSALGYLAGYYVYREHHNPELSGGGGGKSRQSDRSAPLIGRLSLWARPMCRSTAGSILP
jgi:membrane-associated phospholipid phosphatase